MRAQRLAKIDLAGVTYIDSSGVGELVGAYTTAANQGGQLKLAAISIKVVDVLRMTHLIQVFETYDTVDEAVASFA
ncbi:STAS domain-containing protein [Paraliomyxa miuraensis]|uniref:STAS domain-containing protein n=1 Tax=Paraliomyxa miuraensis TaxID=376150 RepID=UPI002251ACC5|nr:STAS domain-containing protein [Paraliomyxa miuraensis]MCX4242538.1 STAS domain-containing protein [Paraliomyxa miuraensis]